MLRPFFRVGEFVSNDKMGVDVVGNSDGKGVGKYNFSAWLNITSVVGAENVHLTRLNIGLSLEMMDMR